MEEKHVNISTFSIIYLVVSWWCYEYVRVRSGGYLVSLGGLWRCSCLVRLESFNLL